MITEYWLPLVLPDEADLKFLVRDLRPVAMSGVVDVAKAAFADLPIDGQFTGWSDVHGRR